MKGKIFRNNLLVGILVMVLCAALFVGVLFRHYENEALDQLGTELQYIAHGMELSGESYLESLKTADRITWISPDGTVLFDNEADPEEMPNHLDREEVALALESGEGQSARWSETLLEFDLYSALRLEDGTVVRISCTQSSVAALLLTLIWPVLIILLIAAALCAALSYRLAKWIVEPINRIDLDHPAEEGIYSELHPLVDRIKEQNRTIQKQMEELTRKQREFSALTENMCEGFLLLDEHMNVVSGNAAAYRVTGDEKNLKYLRRNRISPPVISAIEEALTGVRAETIQKIGDSSWQVIASPIMVHGQVAGAAVLLMDVTEREQREQLRQEFSANVSHELKTPLTSISGFAELMSKGLVSPEKVAEFSGDIYRESQRLMGLVDDILRLSRMEEGAHQQTETVDLYDLCEEVIVSLKAAAERGEVSVSLTGEHVCMTGVRQILRDMIFNLCENAVKYNQPGGTVTVETESAGNRITLSVSDTGIGIPYADQGRVFERFYRVDRSHSREVEGTGLGLSIVKHAVQYHHGNLSLTSAPGKGTKITVVF